MGPSRPLRVLVDATALPANRGGVGRYVDEIVLRLPDLGVDAHVAAQPRDREHFAAGLGRDRVHTPHRWAGRPGPRLAWEQSALPLLAARIDADVVHSPHYTMPLLLGLDRRVRQVVTLHDATFFSDPDLHVAVKARFFRTWTRVSMRRADALIAPSDATRAEVLRHTGLRHRPVTVIPHGVDHERFRPAPADAVKDVRRWLGIEATDRYVAFLGTLEPRKNVSALVRAFSAVFGAADRPPVLVLAGGAGWDETIDAAVAAAPPSLRVLRPGFVPDHLVPALLSGAELVAYPAFGEGFGLPVLEAMACGAAVLTTRGLSLPEVGGDAVAYAASPSSADLAEALAALMGDPEERRRLAEAGVERAGRFTWEATARRHVELFESVAA